VVNEVMPAIVDMLWLYFLELLVEIAWWGFEVKFYELAL